MERSDEELVLACAKGEEDAWATLVARYQRLLYSIPRRAGFDEEAAADVLQQTFLKLLQNLDKIQQPGQIHAWLVTTARRETLGVLRKQKGAPRISIDDTDGETTREYPSSEPLADQVLLTMEQQHRVRTAVAGLDDRCRNLITLLFYRTDSISYAEIAEVLGVSEGSIGPTRARCLDKLHSKLRRLV
ncbi:MAG: sigma-70 family RNA polymerase sigma factor [Pyrinomonadaceae bacterium]